MNTIFGMRSSREAIGVSPKLVHAVLAVFTEVTVCWLFDILHSLKCSGRRFRQMSQEVKNILNALAFFIKMFFYSENDGFAHSI